jgi:putative drug exporter of the RND superfamily
VLVRLATLCYRRRWLVLVVWIVALLGANFASSSLGDGFSQQFSLPASDSQRAMDLLGDLGRGAQGDIVFKADAGLSDPDARARLDTLIARLRTVPGVGQVESPFDPGPLAAEKASPDGRIGYLNVHLGDEFPIPEETTRGVTAAVADACRSRWG